VLLRSPLELLRHADAPEPLAQVRRELRALAIVEIEHERALPRERLTNRLRRDVRVAVHVAADPSAELNDDRHAHAALRERVRERALEALVERRHHAIEHVGQEEQHVLGLVAEPYAFVQALDGLPARRHLLPDLTKRRFELVRREIGIHHLDQVPRDVVLLAQQRAARDLGRMRHEHWLKADVRERALDLVAVYALRFEPLQNVDEPERLRRARVAQVGAAAADSVDLLRHVDHLEVRRERADEVACRARRQRREQLLELAIGRLIAFAVRDRQLARRLDEIEQGLAALLAHELADELAEPMDVLAQRAVLLREEDVRADRPGRRSRHGEPVYRLSRARAGLHSPAAHRDGAVRRSGRMLVRLATRFAVAASAVGLATGALAGNWWAPGDGRPLPSEASYANATGAVGILNTAGTIDTAASPFFQPLGKNGRACVTCHQPADGMALSAATVRERWEETNGQDPLFAAVDGRNCPNLPAGDP